MPALVEIRDPMPPGGECELSLARRVCETYMIVGTPQPLAEGVDHRGVTLVPGTESDQSQANFRDGRQQHQGQDIGYQNKLPANRSTSWWSIAIERWRAGVPRKASRQPTSGRSQNEQHSRHGQHLAGVAVGLVRRSPNFKSG